MIKDLDIVGCRTKFDVLTPNELTVKHRISICVSLLKWNEIEPFPIGKVISDKN